MAMCSASATRPAGAFCLGSQFGHVPAWRSPLAVGVLAAVAVVGASALPSAAAATRDPLKVLRVP